MTDFESWQRKFLMHCMKVAKLDTEEAIRSAQRLEAAGEPLLYGLTDKVTRVVEKVAVREAMK